MTSEERRRIAELEKGKENRELRRASEIPDGGVIVRRQRLDGLIPEYSRAA